MDGKANIFTAGLSSVPGFTGGGGLLPVEVSLLGGINEVSFSTTGEVNWSGLTGDNAPPDGSFWQGCDISSYGVISGIKAPSIAMLVGVFLGPENPSPQAPPILDFNTIGINFTILSPALQQTFFIGDGFTSEGTKQTFIVPAGATRLFLGIADAEGFSGNPGYYDDNTGAFEVTVECIETCNDGIDNDGDGLVDCEDSDCPPCPSPSEVCDNGVDDDSDGLVDCEDPDCATEPACTPGVEITRAKMVSPTELGMAVKVWFPEGSENNRRFVKFTGIINGQPIEREVDVTRYTEPGQEVEIGLDKSSLLPKPPLDGKTPLRIGLQGLGVPRFNENERFELTVVAYIEGGPQSEPDTKEVEILLPVIFVHGYDGPSLLVDIIGDFVIFGQKSSLFTYLWKATSNEDFTTGYEEDAYWTDGNKNSKRYRTLWFEHYKPRTWPPKKVCEWLDRLIRKIQGFTWADRVNIVSHSAGGLVGRYYVTRCNGNNKVDKVIMIGTPNKGSSNVYITSDSWNYSKIRQTLRKGLAQWLIPTYQALYDTNGNPLTSSFRSNFPDEGPPENVTYYSIYDTGVLTTPFELTVVEIGRKPFVWYDVQEVRVPQGGDGTVPESSARLNFGERVENVPLNLGILHINLVEAPEVQAEVLRALRE